MPHTLINGFQMHFERFGDAGEPLVLVHGYTGSAEDFDEQIPVFSKTHRVLVLDHRGHGASEAPTNRESYTIVQMASDVEAMIASVGFERYHLVGHSMGGGVSQEIALRSPQNLLSLTLFGTSTDFNFGRNEMVKKFMEHRNKVAEEQGMLAVAAIDLGFPSPPHVPAAKKEFERKRMESMSVDGFIGGWGALTGWAGTTDRIHAVTTPTLIMAGELEPAAKSAPKMQAKIAGAQLVIIPESGHSPQWERPEIFNEALAAHLARNSGR